ncbi:MAG: ferredoxin-NADP reductase [Pseudomonadota bacterium]
MRLEDYPTEPSYEAVVKSSEPLTDESAVVEVRELVLEVDADSFGFEVGQSIGVLVEGEKDFGSPVHHRLYSIADRPETGGSGKNAVTIVVRRCNYTDDYSGEEYPGVGSNYLCDRTPGDSLTITGPFGLPFEVPDDRSANLLLIGLGTGIAPFRGLVRHIYHDVGDWAGKVTLLYGAQSGLELLYMNDKRNDFARYYDEDTFEAIKALSPRPNWADPIAWDYAIEDRAEEIWHQLSKGNTYVYVSGLRQVSAALDEVFSAMCGSAEVWQKKKAELVQQERWVELLY